MRPDGRAADELRPVQITRGFTRSTPGSVLIRVGGTLVLCTASIDEHVPAWRLASGAGWLTAEYDMLPGATTQRRARSRTGVDGRAAEIQRLVGRALRSVIDLPRLGPRTITLDCDVLEADGGTRTAAITGAYVALCDAVAAGAARQWWSPDVLTGRVAAVSVGVVGGAALLDLCYAEDAAADVDANVVMTDQGQWIEIQMTAERTPCSEEQLAELLRLGRSGVRRLLELQQQVRAGPELPGSAAHG